MTIQELLESAFKKIGLYGRGVTLSAEDLNDGIEILNDMLIEWGIEEFLHSTITNESFALIAGQGSYAIGSGADFDTVRPIKILSAFVRENNEDKELKVFTGREEYDQKIDKTAASDRPTKLHYLRSTPNGEILLTPIPNAVNTLIINSRKPFSSYSDGLDVIDLPDEYLTAIKFNLSVVIAEDFQLPIAATVVRKAGILKSQIETLNLKVPMLDSRIEKKTNYNINEG